MADSFKDSDSLPPVRDDRVAPTADRLPERLGSESETHLPQPSDRNFLEEPPTVISSRKGSAHDSHGRPYSAVELTLGRELVGQTLGHFQLDAFVGAGGMGAVFRGHDTQLNRRVAIKVLSGEHNAKEETVRRFKNEAQSAARLDHPNIARVYAVGEDKGWNYIVFEYIDGTNIRDEVERNGPLELELAISYLVQIAEALDHAIMRDVVHRDIKPSNILIDAKHHAKLVDMGLARLHQVNSQDSDLTASGMTLGTFDYISPEQARDPRSADVRSDLYSLGCTLFFMLTGRPPFPEGTVLQKLLSHSGEEPPDPREFRPELPEEVVHILSRLMAKNPNDRYQMPGELIAAALVVIDDLGLAAPHVTSAVYLPTSEQRNTLLERHLPWAMPVVILLAICLVSDAIWSAQDDSFIWPPSYVNVADLQSIDGEEQEQGKGRSSKPNRESGPGNVIPVELEDVKPKPEKTASVVDSTSVNSAAGSSKASLPARSPEVVSPEKTKTATIPSPEAKPEETRPPQAAVAANVVVVPTNVESLYEAITMVQADPLLDTIELRYNGERPARPLLVEDTSLTIRAGVGYSPTIVFTPQDYEPELLNWMMLITRGSVTLQNISIKMSVPPASTRSWTLFEMENAKQVVLAGCQVTIERNDEKMFREEMRRGIAVVSIRSMAIEPGVSSTLATSRYSTISIQDSLIRGEASMIRSNGQQPLNIFCDNCLLALSGNLLNSTSTTIDNAMSGMVKLTFDGCTIDTGGSIIRRDGASCIPLRMTMKDSIVAWGQASPLLSQRSSTQTTEKILNSLDFGDGNLKYNVYEMSMPTRTMMQLTSTAQMGESQTIDYGEWKLLWDDNFSEPSNSIWATPISPLKLYSSRTPQDYVLLNDLARNIALRPSRRNAGTNFEELPFWPLPLPGVGQAKSATTN
ncbi:serine/threonine protein kinase [Bremerella cremea]|uniref:Serine/threonine protein kinase n=1 Tax=Bremerella cremea TaxID=1031537 RepID=A0A368KYA9_9BACT|nr:serine/threonine-protein kinase [Bremerella cremea]RCS54584.1 serine/threonine protein kinase [Bremerella cremea]